MFRLFDLLFSFLERILGGAFTRTGDDLYHLDERLYPIADRGDQT